MPIASRRQVDASTRWRPLSPGPNSSRRGTPRSSPPLPPRERSSRQAAPPRGCPGGAPHAGAPRRNASRRGPRAGFSWGWRSSSVSEGHRRPPARCLKRGLHVLGPEARQAVPGLDHDRGHRPARQGREELSAPPPSAQSRSRSPRRQPPLGGPRPPPRHLPVQIRGPVGRGHPGGHHHPPGPRGERGVDQDQPVRAPCRHRQLALPVPAIGGPGMDALSPRPPLQVHETAAIVPNQATAPDPRRCHRPPPRGGRPTRAGLSAGGAPSQLDHPRLPGRRHHLDRHPIGTRRTAAASEFPCSTVRRGTSDVTPWRWPASISLRSSRRRRDSGPMPSWRATR